MFQVLPQKENLNTTTQQAVTPKAVPIRVPPASTANPANITSASSPLLPFINENTVEAITLHTKEKFQGKKGILGFGHKHLGVPFKKGAIVPSEKYLADNLGAIAKANNITLIVLESCADEADKPAHLIRHCCSIKIRQRS
ncbi:MAG: hypothetical protein ACKO3R_10250 [bacterium]